MDAILTVILSAVQSLGISAWKNQGDRGQPRSFHPHDYADSDHGRAHSSWLGEQITERGVVAATACPRIFAGIVMASCVADLIDKVRTDALRLHCAGRGDDLLVGIMVLIVAFIVYVERSSAAFQVQYAKRVVGAKSWEASPPTCCCASTPAA